MVSGDMVPGVLPGCFAMILLVVIIAAVAIGGWELAQWLWAHWATWQ